MKHLLSIAIVLAVPACTAVESPTPTRVFDFAPRPLAELGAEGNGTSAKSYLRSLLVRAAPDLAACARSIPHRAGSLDLTLELAVERDAPGVVERAVVEMAPSLELAGCMRSILANLVVPPAHEAGTWVMYQPITFEAQQ